MSDKRHEIELKCRISPEVGKKLNRVGAVLASRYGRKASLEEAIPAMSELFLERLDHARKRSRDELRQLSRSPKRLPPLPKFETPSHIKLQVLHRDRNQCTHVDVMGRRCGVKKKVSVYPLQPARRAFSTDDWTTLCPNHLRRRVDLGVEWTA